jgi:hypothetical protein
MKFIIETELDNIKCPNFFIHNDIIYIFGINPLTTHKKTIFSIFLKKYDRYFNFIDKTDFVLDQLHSPMVRYIIKQNNDIILSIEDKVNNDFFKVNTYLYNYDIDKNNITLIKTIDNLDDLIINIYTDSHYFCSKIEIDEERPDYYWRKYLFNFKHENNTFYRPEFDSIVNYKKDKGHIIHFIDKSNDEYTIIFSIRHRVEEEPDKYFYKIYYSKSKDLIYFYDTAEISIENNLTSSKWYCYPSIFKYDNIYYLLLNQDDFGGKSNALVGKVIF